MAAATAAPSDRSFAGQLSRPVSVALALPLVLLLGLAFLLPVAKLLIGSAFTPGPTAEHYLRIRSRCSCASCCARCRQRRS